MINCNCHLRAQAGGRHMLDLKLYGGGKEGQGVGGCA